MAVFGYTYEGRDGELKKKVIISHVVFPSFSVIWMNKLKHTAL